MYDYESHGDPGNPLAIHVEGSAVLTCSTCGCRLTARESLSDGGGYGPDAAWRHFWGPPGRDGRGCRVECIDKPHRITSVAAAA